MVRKAWPTEQPQRLSSRALFAFVGCVIVVMLTVRRIRVRAGTRLIPGPCESCS